MLCSAATLPDNHYQVHQKTQIQLLEPRSRERCAYGMLERSVTRQPLLGIEHDQLFDKVLGYRVPPQIHPSANSFFPSLVNPRQPSRLTFLADVLPVSFVELDLSPHRLLGHLVRVVRPERLIPAEQDIGDHPGEADQSNRKKSRSAIFTLLEVIREEEPWTHPSDHISQGFPCGFPTITSGAAYPKLPAAVSR